MDKIAQAAELLLLARASGQWLENLPAEVAPQDEVEAYAIQDAVMRSMGPVGGWKVGARGPLATPTCAPLPRKLVFEEGESLPAGLLRLRGVEAEIGFKLGADLPARDMPYSSQEILAAIASVHPTIEVVESRYTNFREVAAMSVLADSNSNGALIVGPQITAQSREDYEALGVVLKLDGAEKVNTVGGNPARDLLRLVEWLANHCMARCGGLRKGEVITTGSHTGMLFTEPMTKVEAEFPGLGAVSVRL